MGCRRVPRHPAIYDKNAAASARQHQRRRQASGPAAHDNNIEISHEPRLPVQHGHDKKRCCFRDACARRGASHRKWVVAGPAIEFLRPPPGGRCVYLERRPLLMSRRGLGSVGGLPRFRCLLCGLAGSRDLLSDVFSVILDPAEER